MFYIRFGILFEEWLKVERALSFLFVGEREKEAKFFHVLADEVGKHQGEYSFFDFVDKFKGTDDAGKEGILKPIKFNKLGVNISFVFVFGMGVDMFDNFIIKESLEHFLIAILFSAI